MFHNINFRFWVLVICAMFVGCSQLKNDRRAEIIKPIILKKQVSRIGPIGQQRRHLLKVPKNCIFAAGGWVVAIMPLH